MSMKESFPSFKGRWAGNAAKAGNAEEGATSADWELRPCGMLVQKRDPDADAAHSGPLIRVKVAFGRSSVRIPVNAHSPSVCPTSPAMQVFWQIDLSPAEFHLFVSSVSEVGQVDALLHFCVHTQLVSHVRNPSPYFLIPRVSSCDLKKLLVQDTGLQIRRQRLLYKGKEKSDRDYLFEAGVKDKSKIVLVEDTKGWEKTLVEMRKSDADAKACKAVAEVQKLVDQISGQIAALEAAILNGKKLSDNELVGPTDLLMSQLIKLEDSKVDGEVKVQKMILIRRVQKYVETLDALKVRNDVLKTHKGSTKKRDTRLNGSVNATSPQTIAMRGKTDLSKLCSETPTAQNTTVVTTTWETFGNGTGSAIVNKPASSSTEPLLIQWD